MVKVTPQLVQEFLAYLRVRVDVDLGNMNVLCLQGISPLEDTTVPVLAPNNNEFNVYNDSILVSYRDANTGVWGVYAFLGTVDPGAAFKDVTGGEAHLTFGQHSYVQGLHFSRPALKALNGQNRVWRDSNKTLVHSGGEPLQVGVFGVDIHAGGTGKFIDNWSAGCVNVWGGWEGVPWKTFMELVNTHFTHKGSVGITVWGGKDFCKFAGGGLDKPTLVFGILNPWVAELQQLLKNKKFYKGIADGDWGEKTDVAVRQFQAATGLTVDGIVGPKTWERLIL